MNQTRVVFGIILTIAVCLLLFFGGFIVMVLVEEQSNEEVAEQSAGTFSAPESFDADTVLLTVASSSTKQKWMEQVVANFTAAELTTEAGASIKVEVAPVLSGGSMNAILDGNLQPVVWSPGSRSWVEQFDTTWRQRNNLGLMEEACQPSIYTPLGIAMWRPMAEALGWPDQPIGWNDIVALAENPDGWAAYDHPEWGQFRFGHAHPRYSNAGLLTMSSFVYGVTGQTSDLTPQQVYDPNVEQGMQTLGQNTAKYGMVTTNLLNAMAKQGAQYLHAVATFESDTVRMNLERSEELRFPLAFIFPSEGTFWGDHPYCVLENADWVSPEQAEAAQIFYDYLTSTEQQSLATDSLLRPLDSNIQVKAPLSLANGTNPQITPDTITPLPEPSAEVSASIIDLFMLTKRKATVLVVLDVSGSMEGEKIRTATEATAEFLRRLDPDDQVGVMLFSDQPSVMSEPAPVRDVVENLSTRVSSLIADGGTALYNATCRAAKLVNGLQEADLATDEQRLYGIVLLSDGEDTEGEPSENQMFATCLPANAEADGVKIFPIAFGDAANTNVLQRIADVTGGQLYKADPESIDNIYLRISAEQ